MKPCHSTALFCFAIVLGLSPSGTAQDAAADGRGFRTLPNGLRYRCTHVDGEDIHAVLCVPVGSHHDPRGVSGMAAALGVLLRDAPRPPGAPPLRVEVCGPFTLVSATTTAQGLGACVGALAATMSPGPTFDSDATERATGKAALVADDADHVFPGPILRNRAARHLLAGTADARSPTGSPTDLRRIDADALRRWHRAGFRPDGAALVLIGDLDEALACATVQAKCGAVPRPDKPIPLPTADDDGATTPAETEHARVAGPFVSLALRAPAPGTGDHLAFVVAVEALRQRAARRLGEHRGAEAAAGFTPLHYDPFTGPPLVLINRRGRSGDDAGPTRIELASFLEAALHPGLDDAELSAAATRLARQLLPASGAIPPRTPRTAARTLVIAEALGWPGDLADRLAAVPTEDARATLRRYANEKARRWFALLPPPPHR